MTRRSYIVFIFTLTGLLAAQNSLRADEIPQSGTAPEFNEVYQLLRANLPGATDESLNRTAIKGLLAQFHGQVSLAGMEGSGTNGGLDKSAVFEGNVAYFRVSRVGKNLQNELDAAYPILAATNTIAGTILDLRFADGDDYAAAHTTAKSIKLKFRPLAILVNHETEGAAEALAASLREAGAGLILGNATAGGAVTFKEFPLSDGERLRIAMPATVNGAEISSNGVQPDVAVNVSADEERAFFENPYGTVAQNEDNSSVATNSMLPFLDHTSEADLVRAKIKDGDESEDIQPSRAAQPQKPVIRDPVLARAADLIKGLAVMRPAKN
jgi:hypothetical protein